MDYKTTDNNTIYYDVEIGDIFLAADGGTYGHLVVGFHENGTDVLVRPFTKTNGLETEVRDIDGFKITYRYYKPETVPAWALTAVGVE